MKQPTKKDVIYLVIIAVLVAALATMSVLYGIARAKEKKNEASYYDRKCASFAVQNANLSKGQIVFIGDSITDLFPLDDHLSDLPLATYNRGIGGDTTGGVLARLKVSLYDLAPSEIVLMIGINDINGGISRERILRNYQEILCSIKQNLPTAKVFCLSVLPMHDTIEAYGVDLAQATVRIKEVNEGIAPLSAEYGYTYVDLFSEVSDGNDRLLKALSDDGIHLNAAGFALWTSVIRPYLPGD